MQPGDRRTRKILNLVTKGARRHRQLSDTLLDRSIVINLERRKPSDEIKKLRDGDPEKLVQYRRQLLRWRQDFKDIVQAKRPSIPEILNDREGDNWFPLLAIAETLGGDWLDHARKAALKLSNIADTESVTTLILAELKRIIEELEPDFLPSKALVEGLNEDKTNPGQIGRRGMV
jgi:putative DNA primase/helicase